MALTYLFLCLFVFAEAHSVMQTLDVSCSGRITFSELAWEVGIPVACIVHPALPPSAIHLKHLLCSLLFSAALCCSLVLQLQVAGDSTVEGIAKLRFIMMASTRYSALWDRFGDSNGYIQLYHNLCTLKNMLL